jgi:hypothetical protein
LQAANGDDTAIAALMAKAKTDIDLGVVRRARIVVDSVTYNMLFERARLRAKASKRTNVAVG